MRRYAIHPPGVWARVENGELLYAPIIVVACDHWASIFISGQMARNAEGSILTLDMRDQINAICVNIGTCLDYVGANFNDVVSTTTHVLDLQEYYAASSERFKFFAGLRPASTLVQVSALGAPEARIEITAEALVEMDRFASREDSLKEYLYSD